MSVSAVSSTNWLVNEAFRLCDVRKAGEDGLGDRLLGEAIREEKRRSKGRKEGVGLPRRGLEANEGRTLLPGDERTEPWYYCQLFEPKQNLYQGDRHT